MYGICVPYKDRSLKYYKKLNISRVDQLRAFMAYTWTLFTAHLHAVLVYRKVYKNYVHVLLHILKKEYPIKAILRSGNLIILHNHSETIFVTRIENIGCKEYEIISNKVTISFESKTSGTRKIGIFFNKEYDFLPVDGKIVIDIGANIGDSCIYFVFSGAKKVIGIEPFPKSYEIAKKNIEKNSLTDKITMQLAGCAAKSGHITIDPLYNSNGSSFLTEFRRGIKIPLVTLRDILTNNNISSVEAALKVDCEGCEYDTILSSDDGALRCFSHIQIEYHHGYKDLRDKLEKCGFQVSVTRPIMQHSSSIQGKSTTYTGYLYAIKSRTKV
jgi:FkbM family methyltransferase